MIKQRPDTGIQKSGGPGSVGEGRPISKGPVANEVGQGDAQPSAQAFRAQWRLVQG